MAVQCNLAALIANSKCYMDPCLSDAEREAIQIYLRTRFLQAEGGADYNNPQSLLSAAKEWQGLSMSQMKAIDVYITQQNQESATNILNDINALRDAAACFACIPEAQRKQALLFLRCALSNLTFPD